MRKILIVAGFAAVLWTLAGMNAGAQQQQQQQKQQSFPFMASSANDKDRLQQEITSIIKQRLDLIKANNDIQKQLTKLYSQNEVITNSKIKPLKERMDKNALLLAAVNKHLTQDETQLHQLAAGKK